MSDYNSDEFGSIENQCFEKLSNCLLNLCPAPIYTRCHEEQSRTEKTPIPVCVCRGHVEKQCAKPLRATGDRRTCDPAPCTSAAPRAAGGICRSSAPASEGNRLWQYRSSAATDDRLRRSAGTCYLSSAWKAPCTHPNDCYSTRNRSRSHLAVRGRRRGMHTEGSTRQAGAASGQPPDFPARTHYS